MQKQISFIPLYIALALVVFGGLNFFKGAPALTLEDRCNMKNGEWLHESKVPTCITADGRWLTYDESVNDFVLAGSAIIAQAAELSTTDCHGVFADYPVPSGVVPRQTGLGVRRDVDFTSLPAAAEFRTAIRRDVAQGMNFAGHYVLASWGCPDFKACEEYAVVDLNDGKIISFGEKVFGRPRYLPDSRMLQVDKADGSTMTYLLDEAARKLNTCTQ